MKITAVLVLLSVTTVSAAQQSGGTDFKELFLEALNSPSGKAKSEVYGAVADQVRREINAPNARIVAEAEVIQNLPQIGCKRMQMLITAPGTTLPTKDGSVVPFRIATILSMCANGHPPGVAG